jgi:hypothetical protein
MATLPKPDPSDQEELVEVFFTNRDSEAQVVKGLLEAADIQALIVAKVGPQDVLPVGEVSVKVAADDADRARQIIAESQQVSDSEMLDQSEANAGPTETIQ